jgi:hypothetical protein
MRLRLAWFFTLYSTVLLAADAGKIQPEPNNVVSEVKAKLTDLLGRYPANSLVGSLANQVLAELPGYQQQLDRAISPSDNGLHLDIILVSHGGLEGKLAPGNRVDISQSQLSSQKLAAQILETLRPQLIGFEGSPGDCLTLESLTEEVIKTNWELGKVVVQDQAQKLVLHWIEQDGALMYYHAHPETKLTGMEETPVYLLQIALQQAKLYGELQNSLNRLRSELGLAKTITQLRKNNLSRGAIVVGYTHEDDYRQALAKTGLSSRFYQTTTSPTQTVAGIR